MEAKNNCRNTDLAIISCLVAYSQRDVFAIERSRIEGFTVKGAARNG